MKRLPWARFTEEAMQGRRVTVFGGTGFVGRYIVKRLAAEGARVRVAARTIESAKFLKPAGAVGQIAPVRVSLSHPETIAAAVDGADAVINAIGILTESSRNSFRRAHVDGPGAIAAAAAEHGAAAFVHISAIGADAASESAYARSKAMGEAAVAEAFPAATILRPSVIFGPEDDFFNRFAAMARIAPALPLIDGGATKFQPVYVGDVATAAFAALDQATGAGKTFELGGPDVMSFRDVLEYVMAETGRKRPLLSAPSCALRPLAALMELLPAPMLTRDQLLLLKQDNIVAEGVDSLADLGVRATAIDAIAPTYLQRYRDGGQFARQSAN